MERLNEKDYIGNPKGKTKPGALTVDGAKLSAQLGKQYFSASDNS